MATLKFRDENGKWQYAPSLKYENANNVFQTTNGLKYKDANGVWHRVNIVGSKSDDGEYPTITFDPVFANNNWENVITACQTGNVPDTWSVGDQMTMNIGGTDYLIDIIGKDHDDYADGSGKAPLTFQLHDCYATTYQMNDWGTNLGGWTSCEMRTMHLPAILTLMPTEVQSGIKEVNKLTSGGDQSSTVKTTADKLFLLSEIEIFGTIKQSKNGEGFQYAYYELGNSIIKYLNGTAKYWWERSPRGSKTEDFCCVDAWAGENTGGASSSYGVSFAFCF